MSGPKGGVAGNVTKIAVRKKRSARDSKAKGEKQQKTRVSDRHSPKREGVAILIVHRPVNQSRCYT